MTKSKQKSEQPPEVLAVADRLHSAAIHLLRRARRKDVESGVGPAQLSALSVLVFGGPVTLGQLAAAEQVRPPTMTKIARGLQRAGLAAYRPDPTDARSVNVSATPKGTDLLQEARRKRVNYLAEVLEMLTEKELQKLDHAVAIIERALRS